MKEPKGIIFPLLYFGVLFVCIIFYFGILIAHNGSIDDRFWASITTVVLIFFILWALFFPLFFQFIRPQFYAKYVQNIPDDPQEFINRFDTSSFLRFYPYELLFPQTIELVLKKTLSPYFPEGVSFRSCMVCSVGSRSSEFIFPEFHFLRNKPLVLAVSNEKVVLVGNKAHLTIPYSEIVSYKHFSSLSLHNMFFPRVGLIAPAMIEMKLKNGDFIRLKAFSLYTGWSGRLKECSKTVEAQLAKN